MQESRLKTKEGVVVRKSGTKSVIVEVERTVKHPVFMKYIRRRKKFHAHDNNDSCQVGDKVLIVESRPISKTKKWSVREVLAHGVLVEKGLEDTAKKEEETVSDATI